MVTPYWQDTQKLAAQLIESGEVQTKLKDELAALKVRCLFCDSQFHPS